MEFYDLKSLVPEITGIDRKSSLFETTEKKIRYIDKYLKGVVYERKGRTGIPKDKKDIFVKLAKKIYEDEHLDKIVRNIVNNKEIAYEERIKLFGAMREVYGEDGFKEYLIKFKEYLITQELVKKLNEITSSIDLFVNLTTEFEQVEDIEMMKELRIDIENIVHRHRSKLQISKMKDELEIESEYPYTQSKIQKDFELSKVKQKSNSIYIYGDLKYDEFSPFTEEEMKNAIIINDEDLASIEDIIFKESDIEDF